MAVETFSELQGHTMAAVFRRRNEIDETEGDELVFVRRDDGRQFRFYYEPDCCAHCYIEDVCGDLPDLVGVPLVEAEVVTDYEGPDLSKSEDSYTWSFYRFRTVKGTVTVRWLGTSNGYYSESVSFEEVK